MPVVWLWDASIDSLLASFAAGFRGRFFAWFLRSRRGRRLLLAFHLRKALLQGRHEIHHGRQFLRPFYFGNLSALEFGLNQFLQVFLERIFVLLGIPLVS